MQKSLNALVIEDNESDAELIVRALKKANYNVSFERVETMGTLKSALQKPNWDIVFSDFQLPGFDALSALEIFKTFNLDIPFIVVSGTIGEEAAVNLIKLGAQNYVMKESLHRLPGIVTEELAEASDRREQREIEIKTRQENLDKINFFKSNLHHLLETKGIKQSQLSREIGISKQTISDWLNKDTLLNIHQALKLTSYFNISVEDLITTNLRNKIEMESVEKFEFINSLETPVHAISFDVLFACGNNAFCDLLGFTEYELNSRVFSEIIHPEDLNHAMLLLKRAREEKRLSAQIDLRYITHKHGFRWIHNICVTSAADKKLFLFSFPEAYQVNEPLRPEFLQLEHTVIKELERAHANTALTKKLNFINEIDPKIWIHVDRDVFRCLVRCLFNQFQFIEFESPENCEVVLKSRVEKDKVNLIAIINCAINTKRLDLARVQKTAGLIGAEVSENYAGNMYSFYITFSK